MPTQVICSFSSPFFPISSTGKSMTKPKKPNRTIAIRVSGATYARLQAEVDKHGIGSVSGLAFLYFTRGLLANGRG